MPENIVSNIPSSTKNSKLVLPQLTVSVPYEIPAAFPVLVSGGRGPEPGWLLKIAAGHPLWAIDHGLDACRSAGLAPAMLLGDGDSADPEAWLQAEAEGIPTRRCPRAKDYTDTQLALQLAIEQQHSFALVTGAFGGRLDHLYSLTVSCAFTASPLRCLLADEQEALLFLRAGESMELEFRKRPDSLSLLPFTTRCLGVNSTGLHWPLKRATITQSLPSATSNWVKADKVTLSVEHGVLGVHLFWA